MKLFRTLTAEVPGELLAVQVGASHHAETTPAPIEPAAWIPAPEHPEIWAALAVASNSNGAVDHTTAGLPAPATTEGDPR